MKFHIINSRGYFVVLANYDSTAIFIYHVINFVVLFYSLISGLWSFCREWRFFRNSALTHSTYLTTAACQSEVTSWVNQLLQRCGHSFSFEAIFGVIKWWWEVQNFQTKHYLSLQVTYRSKNVNTYFYKEGSHMSILF